MIESLKGSKDPFLFSIIMTPKVTPAKWVSFLGPNKITRDTPHDEAISFSYLWASYLKLEIQYHTSEVIVYI